MMRSVFNLELLGLNMSKQKMEIIMKNLRNAKYQSQALQSASKKMLQ